jgi:hypothetical protein
MSPEIELGVVWPRDDPSAVLNAFLGVVEDVTRWGEGDPESDERLLAVRRVGSQA